APIAHRIPLPDRARREGTAGRRRNDGDALVENAGGHRRLSAARIAGDDDLFAVHEPELVEHVDDGLIRPAPRADRPEFILRVQAKDASLTIPILWIIGGDLGAHKFDEHVPPAHALGWTVRIVDSIV